MSSAPVSNNIEDDNITVTTKNTKETKINIAKDYGISDTGVTGYFFVPGAPVSNICPTLNPLNITLPDGDAI